MDDTRFDIIDEPSGIYTVEVRERGKPLHVVDGFDTREEAEAWIKAQQHAIEDLEGPAS